MLDHLLGDFKIGNDTICHWSDRTNVPGRLAKHDLGFLANGQHLCLAANFRHGNNRWLVKDNTPALYINQCIRRSEVNTNISRKHTKDSTKHVVTPRFRTRFGANMAQRRRKGQRPFAPTI